MNIGTLQQIKKLSLGTVIAAYRAAHGPRPAIGKDDAAEYLAHCVAAGRFDIHWITQQRAGGVGPITATVSAPVPAFPPPASSTRDAHLALEEAKQHARQLFETTETVRTQFQQTIEGAVSKMAIQHRAEAKDLRDQLDAIKTITSGVMADLSARSRDEMAALRRDLDAKPAADPATIAQSLRDGIDAALAPFRAAVADPVVAERVEAALNRPHIVAVRTALEVFGVDVRDTKGKPLLFDVWNDSTAPAVDPVFIWTEGIIRALSLGSEGANLWFGGEKGTGKSQTAMQFAARTGRSITRINFHGYSSQEDYIGAGGLDAGSTRFVPGAFLMAFTSPGAVILLDEPMNAKPAHLAPLNALLEPGGAPSIGGQCWTRAPGVCVFAADNSLGSGDTTGRYSGLNTANSSLIDRFGYLVSFDFLQPDEEIDAVMRHTQCRRELAAHVIAAVGVARGRVSTGDIIDPPSIRSVIAFIRALRVMPVADAWAHAIAARQPQESAVGLAAVYESCIDAAYIAANI